MRGDLKPAVADALELIVSGRVIISLSHAGKCGYLEELDGKKVRDPELPTRKMLYPGAYTLYREGLLDQFGLPTEKGRQWKRP